ncbi:hypothetical protein AV553_23710 [Salmonella enterica]|nr:hypothetical protein [Salmonella enterica]
MKAFRRALELSAGERSEEPEPSVWRGYLRAFPRGCCELASQTLAEYLREDGSKLHPYIIGMDWRVNAQDYDHVIVALDGDYNDLTLDQFDGYDDWVLAEPIESGCQIAAFMQKVRNQGGAITTRELMFDGIPDQAWKLYAWLKEVADGQLNASGQDRKPGSMPPPVSTGILPQYRDRTMAAPSDKAPHATEQKNRQSMTHVGIITECYRPREVRLRPPHPVGQRMRSALQKVYRCRGRKRRLECKPP